MLPITTSGTPNTTFTARTSPSVKAAAPGETSEPISTARLST